MPQLVVHVRKEGAERPQPAYAVWVSETTVSVRPFEPEWDEAAGRVEAMLRSRTFGASCGGLLSGRAQSSRTEEQH